MDALFQSSLKIFTIDTFMLSSLVKDFSSYHNCIDCSRFSTIDQSIGGVLPRSQIRPREVARIQQNEIGLFPWL